MAEANHSIPALLLSRRQLDEVTLDLSHIGQLAEIAMEGHAQTDSRSMTVLMLLRERVEKINSLMQEAWEQSKQRAAA